MCPKVSERKPVHLFISPTKMSFIQVFTEAECAQISTSGVPTDSHKTCCKNIIRDFLATKGIELNVGEASWEIRVDTVSNKGAKEWHYDDVTLLNFIINVLGEGTSVLMDDGTIQQIPVGYGCILVGDQGYTMLGLHPTLHRGPPHDNHRCMMKVALVPNYQITHWISGESVCDSHALTYKERQSRLETLLLDAQRDINPETLML